MTELGRLEPDLGAAQLIESLIELRRTDRVLDYGSGRGARAAALAPLVDLVVGLDDDSNQVQLNRQAAALTTKNISFENFMTSIPEISPAAGTAISLSVDELISKYDHQFDLVCSFETFANFDEGHAARALRLFSRLLAPSGHVLLAHRLDTNFSPVDRRACSPSGKCLELQELLSILSNEGFRGISVNFGRWRSASTSRARSRAELDIILAMRQPSLPPGFSKSRYLSLHPDVAAANIDPAEHYMLYGFYEGRQTS